MDHHAIMRFVEDNPDCHLASCDGWEPRVRVVRVFRIDRDGLLFCTGRQKSLHQELRENPRVELCFYDPESLTQIRMRGLVEEWEDQMAKEEAVQALPHLQKWAQRGGWDDLALYHLPRPQVARWSGERALEAPVFEKF